MVVDGVIGTGLVVVRIEALGTDWIHVSTWMETEGWFAGPKTHRRNKEKLKRGVLLLQYFDNDLKTAVSLLSLEKLKRRVLLLQYFDNDPKTAVSLSSLGKRKWDKVQACVYCDKCVAKLPRHLEQKHSDEIEVAFALSLPKNSKRRKRKWKEITNLGNYKQNTTVIGNGSGSIIPCKRPCIGQTVESTDFLPCSSCYGFYKKKDLWRHAAHCSKKQSTNSKTKKRHHTEGAALLPAQKV
ncbi:hypothetical protein LOTGIDRAFT_163214 [Lottia gigantea]|uniref:Uncharacterized protein n=1 Tax=Lottia gigantea TaxID=225164 RepID=V4A9Z1_LOTGI|nr:hypothetical protein LOTGIDRAFT_163214 [Lottia gigantea]ESO91855.1 hypothetical protein LOTGIDRAFT_163214 [Lottia gigantea]